MRWSNFTNDYETIRRAASLVCDVVFARRNAGQQTATAIEQAALALGISKRKARAFYYGEASGVERAELEQMRERFVVHMEQQAEEHTRRAEIIREKLRNGVIL